MRILPKGDFSVECEGLLLAAQDQAVHARAVQRVYSQSSNPKCQLCGAQAEKVEHLISAGWCSVIDAP